MRRKGFFVLPVFIIIFLIGFVWYFSYIKIKNGIQKQTNNESLVTQTITPDSTESTRVEPSNMKIFNISGIITLKYTLPKSNLIKDDLDIIIVDKDNSGTGMCDKEGDDCIWLVSKTDDFRVYAFRRTYLNEDEKFVAGRQYTIEYYSRHYRDSGNLEQSGENVDLDYEKRIVKIPETGSALENFETIVDNEFYN